MKREGVPARASHSLCSRSTTWRAFTSTDGRSCTTASHHGHDEYIN